MKRGIEHGRRCKLNEDILVYIEEMNKLREMLQKNILDANKRKTWLDKYKDKINRRKNSNFVEVDGTVFYDDSEVEEDNGDNQEEYIKFLDYKGKNLFISKQEYPIGYLKSFATYANQKKIKGKVIEIDKSEMFIIGDYISKEQGEVDEECRR